MTTVLSGQDSQLTSGPEVTQSGQLTGAAEAARDPYVTIVLPCYNEQGHVIEEIERISEAMDASGYDYELVAYDDASTDDTLAALEDAAPRFPNLRIVRLWHRPADRYPAGPRQHRRLDGRGHDVPERAHSGAGQRA
jgi:glycosyltransferase involved in cell wall biosynthesis